MQNLGEEDGSTSDEVDVDDPEFLELQERENIIKKYSEVSCFTFYFFNANFRDQIVRKSMTGKILTPIYSKKWIVLDFYSMNSFLVFEFFIFSKTETGLTDEEKAHKLRIEKEYRREKKWKTMLEVILYF